MSAMRLLMSCLLVNTVMFTGADLAMAANSEEQIIVVTADKMLDVVKGTVISHPQITISRGRIIAVTQAGADIPAEAKKIDLPGMTLLPGLIDMHVHLTSDPRYGGYRELEFTDNFWTVVGVANARKTLDAGFTTVRNVGSSHYDDVAIKQAIDERQIP